MLLHGMQRKKFCVVEKHEEVFINTAKQFFEAAFKEKTPHKGTTRSQYLFP